MLSSHLPLGLPSGLFPSGLPTRTLYIPLLFLIHATCPTHLILVDLYTQTVLGEERDPRRYKNYGSGLFETVCTVITKRDE